jgi:hypothetical protein
MSQQGLSEVAASCSMTELSELVQSSALDDRAFADARIRIASARASGALERRQLAALHVRLQEAANTAHRELRAAIRGASGALPCVRSSKASPR